MGNGLAELVRLWEEACVAQSGAAVFAAETDAPPPGTQWLPYVRLELPLRGRHVVTVGRAGEPVEVTVRPGGVLYSLPGVWWRKTWRERQRFVGVVCWPDYTRFLYARTPGGGVRPGGPALYHHVYRVRPAGLSHLLLSINALVAAGQEGVAGSLLPTLLTLLTAELKVAVAPRRGKAGHTWQAMRVWLEENLHGRVTRNDLAREFRLHPNHVSRLFRQQGGMSLSGYLARARIERACHLLSNPRLTVAEVAAQCGFSGSKHFIHVFRQQTGTTPGRYRRL